MRPAVQETVSGPTKSIAKKAQVAQPEIHIANRMLASRGMPVPRRLIECESFDALVRLNIELRALLMWPGLRGARGPSSSSAAPGGENRVITARYNIANRHDLRTGSRAFFACRVETITADAMTLSVPVTGDLGDPVLVQVDRLGELRGVVAKRTRTGFVMSIVATDPERAKLKIKIDWFEKIRGNKVVNKRQHDRFTPVNPHSTLIFSDGSTLRCFVIDMSSSGAAVSAKVVPAAGTPLAVGKVVGRVVRHLPNGFAIRFVNAVDVKVLEDMVIKPSI